jgi:hypothetical protein
LLRSWPQVGYTLLPTRSTGCTAERYVEMQRGKLGNKGRKVVAADWDAIAVAMPTAGRRLLPCIQARALHHSSRTSMPARHRSARLIPARVASQWFDSTHLCRVDHYRQRIFAEHAAGFIESTRIESRRETRLVMR